MCISKVSNSVTSFFSRVIFIIGHRIFNKLSSFIRVHKKKLDKFQNQSVVYKINCEDCSASYVKQTKRQLKTRINEHKNNIRWDSSRYSVITEHILNHKFDWEEVSIKKLFKKLFKRMTSVLRIADNVTLYNAIKICTKRTSFHPIRGLFLVSLNGIIDIDNYNNKRMMLHIKK